MFLLKLLFFPFYILMLPFKLLFGGGSSGNSGSDALDDFLDDCDFFDSHK